MNIKHCSKFCNVSRGGWSEPTTTNALIKDEAIEVVLG